MNYVIFKRSTGLYLGANEWVTTFEDAVKFTIEQAQAIYYCLDDVDYEEV